MISFRYKDLVAAAARRPPEYLETILGSSIRKGSDVLIEDEVYLAIRAQYPAAPDAAPPEEIPPVIPNPNATIPSNPTKPKPYTLRWTDVIQNFTRESVKWAKAGFPLAPKKVLKVRLAICLSCEHWNKDAWLGAGGCRLCGCSQAKLFLATTQCPDNPPRWERLK